MMSSEDESKEKLRKLEEDQKEELVDLSYRGKDAEGLAMDLIEQYTIDVDDFDDLFMVYEFPDLEKLSEFADEELTESTSDDYIDKLTAQYFDLNLDYLTGRKVLTVCVPGKDRKVWLAVHLDMEGNPGSVGAYEDRETLISALEQEGRVTT
jgi:hypothetical protein